MKKILLLNMPFMSVSRPAIGISILKALLQRGGYECVVGYPNLTFAERISLEDYTLVNEKISCAMFTGDWLFSKYLFGEDPKDQVYINTLHNHLKDQEEVQKVIGLREIIGEYLQECLEVFAVKNYDIIGFTTTFEQNLASLALARKIKDSYPGKIIVFGGGNCEGIMGLELHRQFPWIDYACCGEGENSFLQLLKAIEADKSPENIPGIVYRKGKSSQYTGVPEPVHNLDDLPIPDYDDYFAAVNNSLLASQLHPSTLIETARGCWWGEKNHCTFCGLNGDSINFRSKSVPRVLEEIKYLKDRFKITTFVAVDNVMDHKYFKELLPRLKEEIPGISLFYETRPNLKKEQIRRLKEAGVGAIQPGIESLNTHVLKLMRKGSTALQNIQLLKQCKELGVIAAWNLLYGFPGEAEEDYRQIEGFIDAMYHLTPPSSVGPVRLDRFSPYFNDPNKYGLKEIRPFAMYNYIYPLPAEQVFNLAYFFEYEYEDNRQPHAYTRAIEEKIAAWKKPNQGELRKNYKENQDLELIDTRSNRLFIHMELKGIQRDVYEYCDEARTIPEIINFLKLKYVPPPNLEIWLRQFLSQLIGFQVLVCDKGRYLSMAVSPPN